MRFGALELLTLVSALSCGLVAGVFFAFSTFVMRALARLPAPQGVAAMQAINVAVLTPRFLGLFLGAAAASVALGVAAIVRWHDPGAGWLLAGALAYAFGAFGVTVAFHVPRNDTLAALDPAVSEAARYWRSYQADWTVWNHVRTVAALAAAAAFTVALVEMSRP
jgi:uncharacterized membrane protein